jgi:hypothetical protein
MNTTDEQLANAKKIGLDCADEVISRINLGHEKLPSGIDFSEVLETKTASLSLVIKETAFKAFTRRLIKHLCRREEQIKRFKSCVELFNKDEDEFLSFVSAVRARDTVILDEILARKISDLGVSNRTKNALAAHGIAFFCDLVQMSEKEIRHIPNLGRKGILEINAALARFELNLGMNLSSNDSRALKEAA